MKHRPIYEIAKDITKHWSNVSPYALPYLKAMRQIYMIDDMYGADSASSVVRYFLCNAQGFKGEQAKKLKEELRSMLK